MTLTKILQLEDNEFLPKAVSRELKRKGITIELATTITEALAALKGEVVGDKQYSGIANYDAMLLDMNVPDGFGSDIATQARDMGFQGRIVMFSGADMGKAKEWTEGLANMGYLNKTNLKDNHLYLALLGQYSD